MPGCCTCRQPASQEYVGCICATLSVTLLEHGRQTYKHPCPSSTPSARVSARDAVWTAQDLYYFPTKDEEVYKPEQVKVEGEQWWWKVDGDVSVARRHWLLQLAISISV